MVSRLAVLVGIGLFLLFVIWGLPNTFREFAHAEGLELTKGYGIDINSAIKTLFRWWLLISLGYWGVVGLVYGAMWAHGKYLT